MTANKADQQIIAEMFSMAARKIRSAEVMLENEFFDDASSRAYYAAYHAVCAALALKGLSFSSHGRTLGEFNKTYVKTGILPDDTFKKLQRLFENRQLGDYDASACISIDQAKQDVETAKLIVKLCQNL